MSESAYLTYYQKNEDVILNRAKQYYENDSENRQEINTETYLKKKKLKKNMGKIGIVICLKKKKK